MGFPSVPVEPMLSSIREGERISLVFEVLVQHAGCHVCRSMLHGQVFVTDAQLSRGYPYHTILNGVLTRVSGKTLISKDDSAFLFQRLQLAMQGLYQVIEACSGIGAVGQGYQECGAKTVCYVEANRKLHEWTCTKTDVPSIHGDICDFQTIAAVASVVQSSLV